MNQKRRKCRYTKGEKILYLGALFCLLGGTVFKIFFSAKVGHLKMSVEKLKYEIETQEKKVEGLVMKTNELTSFDKVKEVVKLMGLAYHNENIIDID